MILTPKAAERVSRETAAQGFDLAARALRVDWGLESLDAKQVQRWGEASGEVLTCCRDAEVQRHREGVRPEPCPNVPQLLVIGLDGGRYQHKDKTADTNSRWREDKVLTVSSYVPGDGQERKPELLVTTHVATSRDAAVIGKMAIVEAERRGYRQAQVVIGMGDGGNWIDPLFEREFQLDARIIDWCHANEHLWNCAKAVHGADTPEAAMMGERMEALLWDGRIDEVIGMLQVESNRLGPPQEADPPQHARRVLHQNVGYFTQHKPHMDYPAFRAKGWPIGSGVTEAGVKQFNKRVKGTERFWRDAGIEAVLSLRGNWVSQDQRWERYWANRPAYVK